MAADKTIAVLVSGPISKFWAGSSLHNRNFLMLPLALTHSVYGFLRCLFLWDFLGACRVRKKTITLKTKRYYSRSGTT